MGFCSYCYRSVGRDSYGFSNECYGWDVARACSKITGPDDPIRLERKRHYEKQKAKALRAEAKAVRKVAHEKASALEREARNYETGR